MYLVQEKNSWLHECVDAESVIALCNQAGFQVDRVFNVICEFDVVDNKLRPKVVTTALQVPDREQSR